MRNGGSCGYDIHALFSAFEALPQKKPGDFFSDFEILHIGPSSIALANASHVIKILKPERDSAVTPVKEEFDTLHKIHQNIQGALFVLPEPVAYGNNPDFLIMTRLGDNFSKLKDWDREHVGQAIGAFSAELWLKEGKVHTDIYCNNFTHEKNGKIGILDIAAVKKADFWETMLWTPLLYKPNLAPALADEFIRRTGLSMDPEKLEKLIDTRLPTLLASHGASFRHVLEERLRSNLQELKERVSPSRPVPARAPCTLFASRL